MKNTVKDLKNHLFDVIERVKNGCDPDCDPKDTIPLKNAKVIADCAKVIVEAAKTEVIALQLLSRSRNPHRTQKAVIDSGILSENNARMISGTNSTEE